MSRNETLHPEPVWPRRVVVYGVGAIGVCAGVRLLRAGVPVEFVARPGRAPALNEQGLSLRGPSGTEHVRAVVHARPQDAKITADDLVLLTVKLQDSDAALEDLADAGAGEAVLACLQNGVEGGRMALRRGFTTLGVLVLLRCEAVAPGEVTVFQDPPGILDVGAWQHSDDPDPRAVRVAELLTAAGFSSRPVPDIVRWKRGKLLRNIENSIEVLVGRSGRSPQDLLTAAQDEARRCLRAAGLDYVEDEEWARRCAVIVPEVAVDGVKRSGGSMVQSVRRHARTELAYLNGEIMMLGRLHGVPTPINDFLQDAVRQVGAAGSATESAALSGELLAAARELARTTVGAD